MISPTESQSTRNQRTHAAVDEVCSIAQKAIESANVQELIIANQRLQDELTKMCNASQTMTAMYAGERLPTPNESVIGAMKEVALAAIELAKTTCTKSAQ